MYVATYNMFHSSISSFFQPARLSLVSLVLECQWPPWRKCLWRWGKAPKRPWRTGTYVGGVKVVVHAVCCQGGALKSMGTTVVYIWCKELRKLHVLLHATSHVLQGDSSGFTTCVPNLPAGWSRFLGLHWEGRKYKWVEYLSGWKGKKITNLSQGGHRGRAYNLKYHNALK